MKFFLKLTFALCLTQSAAFAGNLTQPSNQGVDTASRALPSASELATTDRALPLITIGSVWGAYDDEYQMIQSGINTVNRILRTACFRNEVLSRSFTETGGLTRQQIYDRLTTRRLTVNVDVFTGSWWQNHVYHTIGYVDDSDPTTVHINRYFVDTLYSFGDNLIHEVSGHMQGFTHYEDKASSVPYQLNEIFENCFDAT